MNVHIRERSGTRKVENTAIDVYYVHCVGILSVFLDTYLEFLVKCRVERVLLSACFFLTSFSFVW